MSASCTSDVTPLWFCSRLFASRWRSSPVCLPRRRVSQQGSSMPSLLTPATHFTCLLAGFLAAGAALCPHMGSDGAWLALPQPRVWLQCTSIVGISNSWLRGVVPRSAGHRCCALSWMLCGPRASTTSAPYSCLAPTPLARRKFSWRWHGLSSARCGPILQAPPCQQQLLCMFVYCCRAG